MIRGYQDQFKEHFKEKFEKKYPDKFQKTADKNKKIVVLCSGCYCPPHIGHYLMMEGAIQHLTQNGYNVLMGIFSVSSDAYMKGKIKDLQIGFDDRVNCLKKLIEDYKKIDNELIIDDFENGRNFIDYPELCQMYRNQFQKYKIEFAYCVGSDLLKYGINHQFQLFADWLIIWQRDQKGVDNNVKQQKRVIILENQQTKGLNSTQIRIALKQQSEHQVGRKEENTDSTSNQGSNNAKPQQIHADNNNHFQNSDKNKNQNYVNSNEKTNSNIEEVDSKQNFISNKKEDLDCININNSGLPNHQLNNQEINYHLNQTNIQGQIKSYSQNGNNFPENAISTKHNPNLNSYNQKTSSNNMKQGSDSFQCSLDNKDQSINHGFCC